MSNGNDWNQGQQSSPPSDAGGNQGGGPGGGGGNDFAAMLTEGWGGGEFDTSVLTRNVKIAFKRALGPILYAWISIALAVLAIDLMSSFFSILGYFSDSASVVAATVSIQSILGFIETPVYFLVAALQFSLYRPMRRELFQGPGTAGDVKSLVESASGVAVPVLGTQLLVYLIASIAGFCLALPGLFAMFILSMSVYMVATRGIGPISGMKFSISMVKKYWQTVAVAFVGLIAIGVAGGCIVTVFTFVIGLVSSILRPFDSLVMDLLTWTIIEAAVFGLFIVWSGVFGTIDAYESGDYIKD